MKGKLKMDPKELSQLWKDATEKIDYKNLEEQGIIKKRGFKFKVQHPVLGYWRLLKKLHRVS